MTRTLPAGHLEFRPRPAHADRPHHALRLRPTPRPRWADGQALARDQARIAELSEANHGKDECLAMVAHELRNALSPLTTAADVLNTPGVSASTSEQARGIIARQLQNMTRLVNDLLDGARITQGTMDVHAVATDLTAVIRHALELVAPQVEQRDQHITVSISDAPWHVLGDAIRLEQAFGNLLHNASKFTRRGGRIWLSAESLEVPGGASEAVIHIRDEGIGITADMLPHVFDLFKQAGHSPHHSRGLGLGLALVRHIVQAHGGRVTLHSGGADQGSEFLVSLPLLPNGA